MIRSIPLLELRVDGQEVRFASAFLTITTDGSRWVVDVELLDTALMLRRDALYPMHLTVEPGLTFAGQAQLTHYIDDLVPIVTFNGIRSLEWQPNDHQTSENSAAS